MPPAPNDEDDFEAAFAAATKTEDKEPKKDEGNTESDQPAGGTPPEDERKGQDEVSVDSLKGQLQELAHKERSSANRVSVFMRQNAQLQEQVAALEAKVATLTAELSSAKATKATPAQNDGLNDVLEDAPELKAAVESRIQRALDSATRELREQLDAANTKLAEVGQTADQAARQIEPLASREEQRANEQVKEQLDKVFPNWRASIQTEGFGKWIGEQPGHIQSLFKTGKTFAEAAAVLKLFYADEGARKAPQGEGAGSTALRNAAGIAPRAATRLPVNKDDFEGAFAEFSAKRER